MLRCLFLLFAVLLTACGRPEPIIGVETVVPVETVQGAVQQKVFIATTRQASDETGVFFSGARFQGTNFASVEVSVPPAHVPGKIERPKNAPPDPRKHFVIERPTNFSGKDSFKSELTAHLRKLPPNRRNVMLFVHGYNTDLTSAVLQVSQFVHDANYDGVPLLFSWASRGETLKYVYDLNSALVARDQLAGMLDVFGMPSVAGFDIIAHSMGTFLVMETSRQIALTTGINPLGKARNVVLASPDIDLDLFIAQISILGPQVSGLVVLVSQDDKALRASRRVAGGVTRIGQMPASALSQLGVNAIDLSEVNDNNSLSHSKFKDSPEVVQLMGDALATQETFSQGPRLSLGQSIAVGVDGTLQVLNPLAQ